MSEKRSLSPVPEGKIVSRAKTEIELGNVICYKDQLLTQSAQYVASFYLTEPLQAWIDETLKREPDHPKALSLKGQVLLQEGKRTESLDLLRRAVAKNPGDLAARLMHPRHEVDKVYEVIVAGVPEPKAIEKLRKGVFIEGGRTAPADVHVGTTVKGARPTTKLTIGIHEGRNRQIRRMCGAVGLPVWALRRIRMGPIGLGRLKPGQWRDLTPDEVRRLKSAAR